MSATAAAVTGDASRVDWRSMSRLSLGHGFVDMCQGAVPALLPTLIIERGLNIGSATALVLIASIGSAVIQPLFGIWSDKLAVPLLAPVGVILAGLGIGAIGFCDSYLALAIALGVAGIGVALFHPEGARMAYTVGGGNVKGMSYFSVGGNLGFALGPLMVLLMLAIGGLSASPLFCVPAVLVAGLLVLDVERLKAKLHAHHQHSSQISAEPSEWRPFLKIVAAATLRTAPFYAVMAMIPLYAIHHLGATHAIGSIMLTVMMLAGACGTLIGGRCADRYGKRLVLVWAMLPLTVFLLILPHVGLAVMFGVLLGVGFTLDLPFSTTVVLGQQYLPSRRGLASGITLGAAIGAGSLLATGLGALADSVGIYTVLLLLPAFSLVALVLVAQLPQPRSTRR